MDGPCWSLVASGRRPRWAWPAWVRGLTLSTSPDTNGAGDLTVLPGHVVDQAALHVRLVPLRDIGLPLISIIRVEPDTNDGQDIAAEEGDR